MNITNKLLSIRERLKGYSNYVLLGMIVVFTVSLLSNIVSIRKGQSRLEEARVEITDLEREQERLLSEISFSESGLYIETQMRDSLGLVKEGEIVVVLPSDEVLRKLAPRIIEQAEVLPKENWEKWLDLFL